MINDGDAGGEEGGEGGEGTGDLLDQPGVIQVSPQDKEAIERVSVNICTVKIINRFMPHLTFHCS